MSVAAGLEARPSARASAVRADASERVLEHVKARGEPGEWEAATAYDSLALAPIDAVWSIGVRYTGVLNVLKRYRAARLQDGRIADSDTPSDLIALSRLAAGKTDCCDGRQPSAHIDPKRRSHGRGRAAAITASAPRRSHRRVPSTPRS